MTSLFRQRLRALAPRAESRRWLFIPYDQLSDQMGPLSREPARELGIVLIESPAKAERRAYHQQKLALVLANLRHFALEQAARGVAVRHVVAKASYGEALRELANEFGPLRVMEPAELELRRDLEPSVASGALQVIPHEGWLTTREHFLQSQARPPFRMDAFYRHVRRTSGVLMQNGRPIGGKFSFDTENRRAWDGTPKAPEPPRFEPDEVVLEVCDLVQQRFARHPGFVKPERLPATEGDAERAWAHAQRECLPHFGPYEDAMSVRERQLFHTALSPLLNLQRLTPLRLVREAEASPIPLASKEGFIRQLLGWREFMRHVHRETEGFRRLPDGSSTPETDQGAADPSYLGGRAALPPAYWGRASGLACLDHVVTAV